MVDAALFFSPRPLAPVPFLLHFKYFFFSPRDAILEGKDNPQEEISLP